MISEPVSVLFHCYHPVLPANAPEFHANVSKEVSGNVKGQDCWKGVVMRVQENDPEIKIR